mmetsp:Transcript_22931/g.47944  ORF Transcript_22931/g.47944 Transcript_22931/m.47944 type:complete len:240 (-) Transcript_22931:109-828(-)
MKKLYFLNRCRCGLGVTISHPIQLRIATGRCRRILRIPIVGKPSAGRRSHTVLDANGFFPIRVPISRPSRSGIGRRSHALVEVPVVTFLAARCEIGEHPGLGVVGHVGRLTSIVLARSVLSFPVGVVESLSVGADGAALDSGALVVVPRVVFGAAGFQGVKEVISHGIEAHVAVFVSVVDAAFIGSCPVRVPHGRQNGVHDGTDDVFRGLGGCQSCKNGRIDVVRSSCQAILDIREKLV